MLDKLNMIKRKFNREVVFIRSDNEGSFSIAFRDEFKSLGITFEESAPDTLGQNGHAERKGKMLTIKARALRIEVELPHYLWVEAIHTACYLANRTSMAKHGQTWPENTFRISHKQQASSITSEGLRLQGLCPKASYS